MGLKISDIVPRREITFEELSGKIIAVDTSQMLYQFLSSIRQPDGTPLMDSQGRVTSHLVGIFSRISNLLGKGIKPCFVFDGKPPEIKHRELAERKERKKEAEEKLEEAREEEDEEAALKYAKQSTRLNDEMINEAKKLLEAMGLPVVQAPSEAEAQAAFICRNGDAWAVASSDYDCLLYEAPRIVQSLTLATKKKLPFGGYAAVKPELVEYKAVMESLGISHEQLMALAILIGTDYNTKGVKGIGPKNALKIVKEHKTLKAVFASVNADFDWEEIYNTFKKMPLEKHYSIRFGKVDEEGIRELLVKEHDFSSERVEKTLLSLKQEEKKKQQAGLSRFF